MTNLIHQEQPSHQLAEPVYTDVLLQFILGDNVARGRIIRLKESYKDALKNHHYPVKINEILAHSAALGCILTSSVKEAGIFTLQLQGQTDSAIRLIVAEMTHQHQFRLTAHYDLEAPMDQTSSLKDLFSPQGIMAFTTDYEKGERYQGLSSLNTTNLSQAATEWLSSSDQVESIISLRSACNGNNQGELAFGLILQPISTQDLPLNKQHEYREIWEDINLFTQSLKDQEALDEALSLQDLLFRLYQEVGIKITQKDKISFSCRCSEEKFMASIRHMDKKTITSLADANIINSMCEYCGKDYHIPLSRFDL